MNKRTILLAVAGLSPQVVTETLYALHQQRRSVDAVHIVTTRRGREAAETQLLSPVRGHYRRYLEEYGIPADAIDFGHANIHTVFDEAGREIEDIEDEEDNERFLGKCLELTFRFTSDDRTSVYFSIAGGRKTMSACLMTAAQLYARPQDRIYHVLVTPEFESSENFFYPPRIPAPVELLDRQGRRHIRESDHSRIKLVHIPFITIRDQLAPDLLRAPAAPESLMLTLVRDDQYCLTVDLAAGKVTYKNQEFSLMPARMALFAFFAIRKKNCLHERIGEENQVVSSSIALRASGDAAEKRRASGRCATRAGTIASSGSGDDGRRGSATIKVASRRCRTCTDCYLDFYEISDRQPEITALYRRITRNRDLNDMSDTGITGLTAENFNSYKGKLRRDLADAFGLYAAGQLSIEGKGKKPDRRYGIRMDRDRIRVTY